MTPFDRKKGIIIAVDVETIKELATIVTIAKDFIDVVGIKIGSELATWYGLPSLISEVRKFDNRIRIIYDHQKDGTDIPAMGEKKVKRYKEAGVEMLIIFPQSGPKTLEAFVNACFIHEIVPIVGLVMTHEAYLEKEGGWMTNMSPDQICDKSLSLGVRNFVLPGTKTNLVEYFSQNKLLKYAPLNILMPGFGIQGGDIVKAMDITSPHHSFPIIGSAIYSSAEPKKSIEYFINLL